MSTLRQTKMDGWFEYYREPCPVCHKTGGCIRNEEGDMVGCVRTPSEKYFSKKNATWLHFLNEKQKVVSGSWFANQAKHAQPTATDMIYRATVQAQLPLLQQDAEHFMHARNLTAEQIKVRGYRSISRVLGQQVHAPKAAIGVGGFFEENEIVQLNANLEGILIPFRNEYNEITGYQIRVTNPRNEVSVTSSIPSFIAKLRNDDHTVMAIVDGELIGEQYLEIGEETQFVYNGLVAQVKLKKGNRYFWLSSAQKPNGCGPLAQYHLAIPSHRLNVIEDSDYRAPIIANSVWLTEGPLKADIACEHVGKAFSKETIEKIGDTFLAIPGVNTWGNVLPILEKLRTKCVVFAFDMDMLTNEYVKNAVTSLLEELKQRNFEIWYAVWSIQHGKGIDDVFCNGFKPQLRRIN